ncbi:metal-dependent hydrolase [Peribacillus sp. SCS-155]|uniref:metal-dependent hydrolase n=1 Tax=Peribacillus sedimenti TaxID=3115297 RepID=UPI003906AFE7
MEGKTHIVGAVAAGALYLNLGGTVDQEVLFYGSLAVGSLIPDIDHKGSSIGRKIPFLDNIISAVFGHRSFTHSLVFLFLSFLLFKQTPWPVSVEFGIWLGMFSHMVLDMLTKQGIKFLWPLKLNIGVPGGIKTGSLAERVFFSALIVCIGYMGIRMYF